MRVCMCIYRYIHCIHYAIYSDLHIISNFMYILHTTKHLTALLEALYNDQSAVIRLNGRHSSAFKIERGVRQGCILSPHLFNLYIESVIREAGIEEMGIKIGGKLVSNLRYADDTALCANSQDEAERLIGKVNIIGKSRLLKLNVKKSKLLKIGKMQCDAGVSVDDEEIEVVEHFKYLGSLKSADGNIVIKTPDRELEWPRKECSILYRYGKTEESPKI